MTVVQRISAFEEGLRPIVQSQGRCCKCKAVRAPGYQDQGSSLQYGLEWSFVPLSPPTPLTRENAEASLEQRSSTGSCSHVWAESRRESAAARLPSQNVAPRKRRCRHLLGVARDWVIEGES